jgi:hypothetical protein
MLVLRPLFFSFMFSLFFNAYGAADIESWVDENGVRHFSNVDPSQKSGEVKTYEEIETKEAENRPRPIEKKWNSYEEICRADPSCNKEMERRKQYENDQLLKEQHRLKMMQELKAKNKKRKEQNCERIRKDLEKFRQAGWENYNPPKLQPPSCPDRTWMNSRGEVFNNMSECIKRRNRYKKGAYERKLRIKEYMFRSSCS